MTLRSSRWLCWALVGTAWGAENEIQSTGSPLQWEQVTKAAAWEPRDSQGEVVFKGKMWIFGGWRSSEEEGLRDIWSSLNGSDWVLENPQAPWKHGDLSLVLAHREKIWQMGGWHGGRTPVASASNEVWSSENGTDWAQVGVAPWGPRLGLAGTVFQGKMWIAGGASRYYDGGADGLYSDVWSSTDGKEWEKVLASAPWSPRAYHALAAWKGKLWLFGGGNYQPEYMAFNDVWCSEDGRNWTCVLPNAPWSPRIWFSAVVWRDELWVMGGWSNHPSQNHNDVWHTADGEKWTQSRSIPTWEARHEHSAFVFDDRIWIAGGNTWPLVNDVWRLAPLPPAGPDPLKTPE